MSVMAAKKKRTGSRHKDRHNISFNGELYERIRKSAEKNGRPINWEAKRLVTKALDQESPPPPPQP
jgi:hypothetical protein